MKKFLWQIPLLLTLLFAFLSFGANKSYAISCSTGNDCPFYMYCDGGIPPFNNGTCRHFDVTANGGGAGACDNSSYSNLGYGWFTAPSLGNWNGYSSWSWLNGGSGDACPEGIIFGKHVGGVNYCKHTGNCTSSEYNANPSNYSGSPICEVYDTSPVQSVCGFNAWGNYNVVCSGASSCTNFQACTGSGPPGVTYGPCPGVMNYCDCLCPIHEYCTDAARTTSGFWTYDNTCNNYWCKPYCDTGGPVNCTAWNFSQPGNTCGTTPASRTCQHNTNPNGACVITSKSNYTDNGNVQYNYCNGPNYTCPNINGTAPVSCVTHIYAQVYKDWEHDGVKNNGDVGYAGITVSDHKGSTATTGSTGLATFSNETSGSYTISITVPAGWKAVNASSQTINLSGGNQTVYFYLTPLYKISGNIYNDKNKNLKYDGIDTLYTSSTTVHLSGGPTTVSDMNQVDGTYDTGQVLESGTYTVSQTHALANGYNYTTPSTWAVTVGDPAGGKTICDSGSSLDASCTNPNNGSVANLNFGVSNENPWGQSVCFDVRDDSGSYTDQIPAAPSCGGVSGAYNSITNADCSTGAGIIFTCDATPDFGLGSANANAWQSGGAGTQQECFSGAGLNVIRTSYDYLLTTARESGIVPTDLSTICNLNGCTLPSNLSKGVYIAHGDLHLNAYTFPVSATQPQGFIFLIDGNLYIQGNILVPAGSVAAFSTSKNIYVDASVGNVITSASDPAVNNPNIEGLYSADADFIIQSNGSVGNYCNADGTPKDKKLNIVGSIITNAAQNGGALINNRDLCIYDLDCSSVSYGDGQNGNEGLGLSYILTLFADGKFLNHKLFNWQELKP